MDNKILVTYFSASGVTARAAKEIASSVGADIAEIKPAVPYTSADLNWMDKKSRTTLESKDMNCRPEMAADIDVAPYDTVFVGFPVWWYREPAIIDTFLESDNFSGKKIIPFATSGGSGIEGSERHMKEVCPSAVWVKGKLVNRGAGAWAKEIIK